MFAYFGGLWQNKEKIHQIELEKERLHSYSDSLYTVVSYRDSMENMLKDQIITHKEDAAGLRDKVESMEQERKENQISVRRMRKEKDLLEKFEKTFPEMAQSDWGVTEIVNENGFENKFLVIPLWFNETFILDHQRALSYLAQRDTLLQLDSLNQVVITLQDSVITLETLNRKAFEEGFNVALVRYDELSDEYINELKKGKVSLEWSLVGAAAVGVAGVFIGRGTK
jgi:chromosome segregation ATPase